ncbi:hypothetical protein ACFY0A_05425 [Streptomyces sp. NPDC001698]|uniref:hypothetical protein n=1 Tax=Streptomyces sp. NPDC001698 TaxID=3364601 RepID=UPI0036889180
MTDTSAKAGGPSVNFPPVLNGLDFLESTVDLLSVKEDVPPRNLKYAVVHLASAAETLFKARLAMKTPALVWAAPGDYDPARHVRGDFKSCGWEDARKRVIKECSLETELLEPRHFRALAQMRNRIAHVGVTESALTVEVLTTPVLDNLLTFVREDLLPLVEGGELALAEEAVERIRPGLGRIQRLVDRRMEPARELLGKWPTILGCPVCAALAVPVEGGGDLTCVVCDSRLGSPREAAWIYADTSEHEVVTGGGSYPVHRCDECGTEAVTDVPTDGNGDASRLLCLFCGLECEGVCGYCGLAVSNFAIPDADMCGDCFEYRMQRY